MLLVLRGLGAAEGRVLYSNLMATYRIHGGLEAIAAAPSINQYTMHLYSALWSVLTARASRLDETRVDYYSGD
jgi:hypothetical protein